MRDNQQLYIQMSDIIDTYRDEIIQKDFGGDDIGFDIETEDNFLRCFIEVLCAKYFDTFGGDELRDMLNSVVEDMEEAVTSSLN